MIVQCESCRAQFDVEDAILMPSGRKLKCSQCSAVFFQPPPKGSEPRSVQEPDDDDAPTTLARRAKPEMPMPEPAPQAAKTPVNEPFPPTDPLQDGISDGLDELLGDDLFGDLQEMSPFSAPSQSSQVSLSDAGSGPGPKESLINNYIDLDEEEEVQEPEPPPPPPPPPPPAAKPAPPAPKPAAASMDDDPTQMGTMPHLALAKPTARELELARLAQEKKEKAEKALQEKKQEPVVVEKPEKFIKMDEKWNTGEPSLDDDEPSAPEPEEEPEPIEPVRFSTGMKLLAGLLLLLLGAGAVLQTDWGAYKRFDMTSPFRFGDTQGEWRRYPFGMMLVVSGTVTNTSRVVQMVPGIRVELLTEDGKSLGSSQVYPGRVIDAKTLDESSETALRSMTQLQAEDKKLKMNKLLMGNEAPFQAIFLKPADGATRFRLHLQLPDGKEQTVKEKPVAGGKGAEGKH
ncbi:MAG: zinc-ribbon domain-containing protein [Magnetococcales bacterium]|nr:zinc-ribbon domain-containing protein [Magnetococcales bacterium]